MIIVFQGPMSKDFFSCSNKLNANENFKNFCQDNKSILSKPQLSSMDSDLEPFFSTPTTLGGLKTNSTTFQSTNLRTVQRTMAFQSSVGGRVNPPVVVTQECSSITKCSDGPRDDLREENLREVPALPPPEDKSTMKTILQKIGIRKKKEENVFKENVR